ncbi:uncharacterized protein M421DRAFT_417406 [Didymella exigua CBS 183.55]|uniref:Mediator of RNA polymerase II transcription subunit 4 n=1 Tax=Didymella exigua CBS 183.55 TaxID=1150837 RepID=A0A6A5RWF5_9PLEO|nr:uncharacterized protein M421DRAFT_417406 [Didymella exigua CBS 183.55]KAF1931640.1 hypothetical protein M421DRAFT_417406 [Didymella exigua CBS 183.55]
MDDVLQAQFDRVEQALGTLVDSIASYNPNPQAAVDLVAADNELSHGLDQLARHQANHARLQTLRAEAEALEEQLKSSVAALASLRRELSETPATVFPAASRPVPFDELLQYAKSISRYTVPPTFRERVPDAEDSAKELDAPTSAPATNGLNTPTTAVAPVEAPHSAVEAPHSAAEAPHSAAEARKEGEAPKEGGEEEKKEEAAAVPEISAAEAEWLQKLKDSGHPWFPWPHAEKIRRGSLWKLYYYREHGRNLDEFDIEAHEEAERKAFEHDPEAPTEKPADVQAEPHVQDQRAQQGPPPQAASAAPAAPPAGGFTLFDDMESDDE